MAKPSKAALLFARDQLEYGTAYMAGTRLMPWQGLSQGERDREWLEERARMWSTDPVVLADFVGTLGKNLRDMPGNSGGFIFSSAANGMTAQSPGMAELSQFDSENMASNWLVNSRPPNFSAAGLEAQVNPKHSIASWLGDRWDDAFEATKNTTRNVIVGASAPFEAVIGAVRSAYGEVSEDQDWVGAAVALAGIIPGVEKAAEEVDAERFNRPGAWEQTNLATSLGQYGKAIREGQGPLEAVGAGQGEGWLWIDPEMAAGEQQRQLAYEAARVQFEDGSPAEAWTVGRGLASIFTEGPDDQAYRIGSGVVDIAAAVLLDPLTYIAPYAKALKARQALKALGEAATVAQADKATVIARQLDEEGISGALEAAEGLGATQAQLAAAQRTVMREQYRRAKNDGLLSEEELEATENVLDAFDELVTLDPYGPAYQSAQEVLARGLQTPKGYEDNAVRLQQIAEELDYIRTRRGEMKERRGQGKLILDNDPTDAIDSVVRTWGAESIDAAYGRMSTAAANLGETHRGRWAGTVTYTPPAGPTTWMPGVTRDGEMLLTYPPGKRNFVASTDTLAPKATVTEDAVLALEAEAEAMRGRKGVRAKRDEAAAARKALEEGAAGQAQRDSLLAAFRGTFSDEMVETFANPRTRTQKNHAKVYRGFEDLLSREGTTWEELLNFAGEMGVTHRLQQTLRDVGIDGIDDVGRALGTPEANLRWVANESTLKVTAITEQGRSRLARLGLEETLEQQRALADEQGQMLQQQRQWDADIELQQISLGHADELVRQAEMDAARLDELLGSSIDAEEVISAVRSERDMLQAEYRLGMREGDAYSAMLRALGMKMGVGVNWETAARNMDIEKARDFFANSATGKLVLRALAALDSPGKIAQITRHRFDDQMIRDLAAAKTEDEALAALWYRLGDEVTDPLGDARSAREAMRITGDSEGLSRTQRILAKRGENKTLRRLASFVPSGRHLELSQPQQMGRELENFGRNMGLDNDEIAKILDGVYAAETEAGRRQAAYDAMDYAQQSLVKRIEGKRLTEKGKKELEGLLSAKLRLSQKEGDEMALYLQQRTALTEGKTPEFDLYDEAGNRVEWNDAFTDAEFIQGTIPLPDSDAIRRIVGKFSRLYESEKTREAWDFLDYAVSDVWRTAMLAFRPSYIVRNIAEMEMRMFLTGHQNAFSNPLASAAMFFAARQYKSPKMEALRQSFTSWNEAGMRLSATGEDLTASADMTAAQARLHSEAQIDYRALVDAKYSVSDYRLRTGVLARNFSVKTVTSGNPKFQSALAQQFLIRRSGALDQIAMGGDAGYESLRNMRIDYVKRGFTEEDATVAWFTGNPEGAELARALGDASPAIGHMLANPELARGYLYDWDHSIREWGRIFTNNGDPELVEAFVAGKVTDGRGRTFFLSDVEEAFKRERVIGSMFARKGVDQRVIDAFATEGLPWWDRTAGAAGGEAGIVKRGVDWFFDVSAKFERAGAMGPEWKWAYWEEIGKRASMLDAESLEKALKIAERTLPGGRRWTQGRNIVTGRNHPALDALRRAKGDGPLEVTDIEGWASKAANKHVEDLFYMAQNRRQFWHSSRLIFPFGQAWGNSAVVWAQLGAKNPYQVYRFARAWRAATGEQAGAAYDAIDPFNDHPANEGGFFFRDEQRDGELMFKYPTWMTSLGGILPYDESMEMVAPVSSLNLAFGGDVPLPGVGPVVQMAVSQTGIDKKPSGVGTLLRNWAVPFGNPEPGEKGTLEAFAPVWSRYAIFGALMGNEAFTRTQFKGAAVYMANEPGRFSDLADEEQSRQFMEDAWGVARMSTFFRGVGSLLLPASPQLRWKSQDMGGEWHWIEQIADEYRALREYQDNDKATTDFLDRYGDRNILVALSTTNGGEALDTPAWEFYQQNPELAEEIGLETLNLLFPGDVSFDSLTYFRDAGIRDYSTTQEMANHASRLLYQMEQARAEEKYARLGWTPEQYEAYVDMIDDRFGGPPPQTIDPAVDERKERALEKALEMPQIQALPQYPLLFEAWASYKQALWDYQQASGDNSATLRGKDAAAWREALYSRFAEIRASSLATEEETGTLGATGLIAWIERRLISPRSKVPTAAGYAPTSTAQGRQEEGEDNAD